MLHFTLINLHCQVQKRKKNTDDHDNHYSNSSGAQRSTKLITTQWMSVTSYMYKVNDRNGVQLSKVYAKRIIETNTFFYEFQSAFKW